MDTLNQIKEAVNRGDNNDIRMMQSNAPTWLNLLLSEIEAKDKEIERLKKERNANLVFINNGWEEERYDLQEQLSTKDKLLQQTKWEDEQFTWLQDQVKICAEENARLREALERIEQFPKGNALTYVQEIKSIAREALKE